MEFPTSIEGDKGIIVLEGDLDNEQSGELLKQAFETVFERGKRTVVLDMANVQIINSYGIGKILSCYKQLRENNGSLFVRNPQGFVKDTLELLMLDQIIHIEA